MPFPLVAPRAFRRCAAGARGRRDFLPRREIAKERVALAQTPYAMHRLPRSSGSTSPGPLTRKAGSLRLDLPPIQIFQAEHAGRAAGASGPPSDEDALALIGIDLN
jgi:hypothetical protein